MHPVLSPGAGELCGAGEGLCRGSPGRAGGRGSGRSLPRRRPGAAGALCGAQGTAWQQR